MSQLSFASFLKEKKKPIRSDQFLERDGKGVSMEEDKQAGETLVPQ